MPRFSVIVPAHQVQPYLHECLDSVLQQSFRDLELIAVNDHSPDSCGEIIDEFAAADPRVRPVHLRQNVGLGPARNAGLELATGDYVLFLDSDDSLAPGSLRAISDRLAETHDPQVLIYDYARTYWYRRTTRNIRAELLEQRDPQVFRLTERPDLLNLLMVVWNKAYRRDYVLREGFSFPPGYYEDTPWTYPVLLNAHTIATLDRVCVLYRQRRNGNILGTTSDRHFDVFDQYDRVFAHLSTRPELDVWRAVLYDRMVDHLTTIYKSRGRVPRESRAEFFRRSRDHARRYRVPGGEGNELRDPGSLRHLLVLLGARRTYHVLGRGRLLTKRFRNWVRARRRGTRQRALRAYYAYQRKLPLDPNLALFAAYWNRGYSCNPAAIEAKARELSPGLRTLWATTEEYADTLPEEVTRVHPGSWAYWRALARAKYLVNNVNFPTEQVKRPGQVYLQTHHGTPLKHMGIDLQDHPAAAGMSFRQLLRRVDRWDYSLSSNRHSTLVWERTYPSHYTSWEYGYPRNDVFQNATEERVAEIRRSLGIPSGTMALLYAPTHRDYQRTQHPHLDPENLARALGPGFVILTRSHYFNRCPDGTEPEDRTGVIDVSRHPSVEELCLASNALVTDYSSLMFDYANLDRPIVILADDWEAYRAARGTYFDLMATPPGLVARSEEELTDIFATSAWHGPHSARLRAAFRERFCTLDDGRAAERVVRALFLDGQDVPPVVPLERRTPAPLPPADRPVDPKPIPGPLSERTAQRHP
ncbi:bifunctional glycosyltransferase family 2 protein/CDP-glycerol:glycerophosphate glycerophosphotransferase [Streptomyces sp. NPDC005438]|uniref:bifunctional glycosyltransferase/CDP-glycerol:glycerophosphate glycerophosphotransferase n=1 Tax=Streptomyces sp. NPDC005438 TaxID=3156880 RepID=UPI0033AFD455